jgi:hypothetical protein
MIFMTTLHAQYSTPGTGVTWDLDDLVNNSGGAVTTENDAYLINDDLLVADPDTLRLLDNAVVKFQAGKLVTVQGVFQADPPDSLLFTAADLQATYKSFRFEDSDASFLKKCRVEYGGGIDVVDSDLLFEECHFSNNDKSNVTGVIDLFHANPQVINCTFQNNQGPAILSGANSECSPFIYGNYFYRNNTLNTNMPQVNLGTSAPGIPIQIIGNTIEGFYDKAGGIAVTTLAGGTLNCVIDSNEIFNNRYGITAYGFDIVSTISNNNIYDNNIENLPMQGGSGINFWGNTSNVSEVFGNEINGNLWGITVTGEAFPNLGQVEPDTLNPGRNKLYDNGNNGIEYALYNNTPNDIYAENNYWGSYDLDSVEMVIFHYPDDETLGFVDYLPIMDSLITKVSPGNDNVGIAPFPNPADSYVRIDRPGSFDDDTILTTTILDSGGQPQATLPFSGPEIKIDVSGLSPGIYFIRVSNGKRAITTKLVRH